MDPVALAVSKFTFLDGGIVGLYLLATMVAGIMVRKYVGKVEHFLIAGREMNLYLGIASLAATEFGIVTCMYTAQGGYKYGFAWVTPGIAQALAMLLIGLTGFCVRPLRDAGVMTIPELFEKRFGSRIRWAAGVVIVLGGLLNMGTFLRMGGDFLVTVTGVSKPPTSQTVMAKPAPTTQPATALASTQPEATTQPVIATSGSRPTAPAGPARITADYEAEPIRSEGIRAWLSTHVLEVTMTVLLLMVAVYTILGGMLSVLITDFLQFVVMSAGLIIVTVLILVYVGWDKLVAAAGTRGEGGFNPLVHPDLGYSWVFFQLLLNGAATLTWQTTIQRLLAAKDTRTGQKVYTHTSFFFVCRFMIPVLWGLAALAVLTPAQTAGMTADDASKFAMPIFLSQFLPVGLMGILVAAMLAADMSTDSSYMLSWGSVIYNDIMAPIHKKKWPEKKGLLWSRCIVALIGLFLLFYGLWYKIEGNIWDYLTITGTIYLASMSVLLIACCYWKRANSWGAAGAIILGGAIPLGYLTLNLFWRIPDLDAAGNLQYDVNHKVLDIGYLAKNVGTSWSGIAAFAAATMAMIIGSLVKPGRTQTTPTANE